MAIYVLVTNALIDLSILVYPVLAKFTQSLTNNLENLSAAESAGNGGYL